MTEDGARLVATVSTSAVPGWAWHLLGTAQGEPLEQEALAALSTSRTALQKRAEALAGGPQLLLACCDLPNGRIAVGTAGSGDVGGKVEVFDSQGQSLQQTRTKGTQPRGLCVLPGGDVLLVKCLDKTYIRNDVVRACLLPWNLRENRLEERIPMGDILTVDCPATAGVVVTPEGMVVDWVNSEDQSSESTVNVRAPTDGESKERGAGWDHSL